MGTCNLNHSLEDVLKKFESQRDFLPSVMAEEFSKFLREDRSQQQLNEAFHLLKKYDLSDDEERSRRNSLIQALITEQERN